MAELKKISELKPSQVNDNTEFLVIDESLGKTNRVSFSSLKDYLEQTGQNGRSGDDGIKGSEGPKGPKGFKGISANEGRKGFSGGEGDVGERGGQGRKGVKGVKGVNGQPRSASDMVNFRGESGDVGETGGSILGDKGSKGSQVTGELGQIGPTGLPGENASNGQKGVKGVKGQTGLKGQKGSLAVNAQIGNTGVKGTKSNTEGPKGSAGAVGVAGSPSYYKFNFYHDLNASETRDGFKFTEGSTIPSYSNDEFVHNNSSGGGMRGTNNRFQKISGGSSWNAGIKSKSTKSTNLGAWGLTIVPNIEQQTTMYGLSLNPSANYTSLDYAFYFSQHPSVKGYGMLTIREKGVQQNYGEETGKMHGINPNTAFVYLFTPGMQYHIDWDGVNKKIIYRASNNLTGELWTARIIDCPWVNKNVYAAACFYQNTNSTHVDATRYLLWR
jgi:hypothetical protein